jgi:hypothetical protein
MDIYWLEAWLVESPHGLHARGLLGALTHWLAPRGPDVLVINIIAVAFSIGLVAALTGFLYSRAQSFASRAAIAVLLASPLCALFFEEIGDPLIIAMAVFLVVAFCMQRLHSKGARLVLFVPVCIILVLIHEATLFLVVPALVLVSTRTTVVAGWASLLRVLAVAVPLLAAIMLTKSPTITDTSYQAINSRTGEHIPRDPEPFPGYAQLLHEEADNYFGSSMRIVQFVGKFPRVWCIPLLGLALLSGVFARGNLAGRLWRHWLFLSICSAPLYVIAHDWARFSLVTFWLAVVTALRAAEKQPLGQRELPPLLGGVLPQRFPSEEMALIVAGGLILAANAVYTDYRVNGMPQASLPIIAAAFLAWLAWVKWNGTAADR